MINYQKLIENSSLRFRLKGNSIQLATQWYECTQIKYIDFQSKRFVYKKLELENDLVECLAAAIKSLQQDNFKEKKSRPGWSFGYVCGHVQGALNTIWTNRYIIESRKEFEDILKLKTIMELLKIDDNFLQKIEIIYDHFNTHRYQAINEEEKLPENVISLTHTKKIKKDNKEIYRKEFNHYFEKLLITNYMSLLNRYDAMCCPDLTHYIDEDELVNLVGVEHFA